MEWLLRRPIGKSNSGQFILEENELIKSEGALHLLMNYFTFCTDAIKGKVIDFPFISFKIIQDLCMLVKWNKENCIFLLKCEEFHWWLLEIILDLSVE